MMLVAVFIGLAAAGGVFFYVQGVQKQAAKQQVVLVNVVVAKEAIPARSVIEEKMLETKQLPELAVTPEMIRDNKEILGKVTTSAIIVGEIIQRPKIAEKGAGMGLSFIVPPGKRAITVKVDDVLGVAGLIKPGDFVDVLATFDLKVSLSKSTGANTQESSDTENVAVTILQNAQVLALDQMMEAKPPEQDAKAAPAPGGGTSAYVLVTLAVMPKDAEKIHVAYQKGPLRLTLRPLRDFTKLKSAGTALKSLAAEQYAIMKKNARADVGILEKGTATAKVIPSISSTYPKVSSLPMPSYGMPSMPSTTSMPSFFGQKFGPKQEVQVIKGTTSETVGGATGNTGTTSSPTETAVPKTDASKESEIKIETKPTGYK